MTAPDRFRFIRPYDPGTLQRSGRRRTIIAEALGIRLGHQSLSGLGRDHHHEREAVDGLYHGRLESVSAVIGMLASSSIGMLKLISSLLISA